MADSRTDRDETRHDERHEEGRHRRSEGSYPDDGANRAPVVADAKTSAAAVFGLIFGLSALICVLTVVLSPVALVLGIIGLIVAIFGMKMAGRPGVTGKAVAITGLVMSVLAVLLSLALVAGATFFLNDQGAVERLEDQVAQLRAELPDDIPQP